MAKTLGELAKAVAVELHGDADLQVEAVATLGRDRPGTICFLGSSRYRKALQDTQATAVILPPELAADCPVAALVSTNPYLSFARVASELHPPRALPPGIDASAQVSAQAELAADVRVGANAVIEAGAVIAPGVQVGPACIVRQNAYIGAQTRLVARVTVAEQTQIGQRCLLHPGAVIGADGFGFAQDERAWVRIPQLGRVVIGDDVDIGANTTIDRGALDDTVIESGAKIDNQVQLGHNVRVGAHAAIAACVGIAGSTTVGKYCQLGGGCGIAGHLVLADGVVLTGGTLVHNSIKQAGVYSGGAPAQPNLMWRKNVARSRQLDDLARRLKSLERRVNEGLGEGVASGEGEDHEYDDNQ